MIYLNNAATSFPKPPEVIAAHTAALGSPPASQFRGAEGTKAGEPFDRCRKALGKLFGIRKTERIFFSSGATDSLNRLLYGLVLPPEKNEIVTTVTEHNSVLRPLCNLEPYKKAKHEARPANSEAEYGTHPADSEAEYGTRPADSEAKHEARPADSEAKDGTSPFGSGTRGLVRLAGCDERGRVSVEALRARLTDRTGAVLINHCSNVTGAVQDLYGIAKLAKEAGALLLVDASQSAGCIPFCVEELGIDALVFTGHKSLYGVQGTGGYYIKSGAPFHPAFYGGTGRDSRVLSYGPENEEYEVGTQNGPGIAALCAGVEYVLERGVERIHEKERELTRFLYEGLTALPTVTAYGNAKENEGPVVSFTVKGLLPSDAAYILQNAYGIVTRTGLHCAPLIHAALGTGETGTVRVSFSDFTTAKEVESLLRAVREISGALHG